MDKLGTKLKSLTSPLRKTRTEPRRVDSFVVIHQPAEEQATTKYPDYTLRTSSEIVYLDYDPQKLPPPPNRPEEEWTRFVCISDTHCRRFDVPDGDVLLHSGDLTNTGLLSEVEETMEWLRSLPHKVKIIVAGNHDLTLHKTWYEIHWERWHSLRKHGKQDSDAVENLVRGEDSRKAGIIYLENEKHEFSLRENGKVWTVYGSPWSPEFGRWAFNYDRGTEAEGSGYIDSTETMLTITPELIKDFPICDILLTHGPPHHILDRARHFADVGCATLRANLARLKPRLHLFGHIHEARGAYVHVWDPNKGNQPPKVQNRQMTRPGEVHDGVGGWPDENEEGLDDLDVQPDFDSLPPPTDSEDEPEASNDEEPESETDDAGAEWDHTVFVNAANWPSGPGFNRGPSRPFGGPGFQPIVVDLRDD